MPHALATTSIKHRALTLTVRTLQCGHTVWGKTIHSTKHVSKFDWNLDSPMIFPSQVGESNFPILPEIGFPMIYPMWRFPEIGVPLVFFRFRLGFSTINHINHSFWDTPICGTPQICNPYKYFFPIIQEFSRFCQLEIGLLDSGIQHDIWRFP